MTGYKISVGYNSNHSADDVWDTLKSVGIAIADDYGSIASEAFAFDQYDINKLQEFAKAFGKRTDFTIRFLDENPVPAPSPDEDWEKHISMHASGGGQDRLIKESLRRAFIRLVLGRMHEKQMEINISVG